MGLPGRTADQARGGDRRVFLVRQSVLVVPDRSSDLFFDVPGQPNPISWVIENVSHRARWCMDCRRRDAQRHA